MLESAMRVQHGCIHGRRPIFGKQPHIICQLTLQLLDRPFHEVCPYSDEEQNSAAA